MSTTRYAYAFCFGRYIYGETPRPQDKVKAEVVTGCAEYGNVKAEVATVAVSCCTQVNIASSPLVVA
ncbi:hypothetical protein [Nostoc sp.]|uniref:hypothetical protein n=1 Tax=Nostoc sp. TaxID=1180 RepID=UPI002FFC1D69